MKMMTYSKNMLLRIKSEVISRKNLIASMSIVKKKKFKTKRKSHGDEASDFYDEKIPKVDSNHTCLVVIRLDSVLKKDENYYPQVFLKECK